MTKTAIRAMRPVWGVLLAALVAGPIVAEGQSSAQFPYLPPEYDPSLDPNTEEFRERYGPAPLDVE